LLSATARQQALKIEERQQFADNVYVRVKGRKAFRFGPGRYIFALCFIAVSCEAQTVTIDTTPQGRRQSIDGFGTCISGTEGEQAWWQDLFINDLQASIVRMDLTPSFKSPYSDFTYNSPWFHNNPPLPGPETNNVRTYTNAASYQRLFAGRSAPIAVMGPDINQNTNYFNFNADGPRVAGAVAKLGASTASRLAGFKLISSHWSPMPLGKISSGNSITGQSGHLPVNGHPWPLIWGGEFPGPQ